MEEKEDDAGGSVEQRNWGLQRDEGAQELERRKREGRDGRRLS